ncbi:MAG: hypothetical protein OMM_01502 [Candidatus Magnetoglobus multicellularis str. Araruama]|uniref:Uncharacterized protein n=1 Tax=Candidatus Magnetoglobus multicellularis str. Araruama TaxID=890399 RepID=A0A1V1PD70_9BACT|nr:MAG: hypothetical protein OMM_01502 [Candidatus Magnetoglobus multicellularis str. Araruama]
MSLLILTQTNKSSFIKKAAKKINKKLSGKHASSYFQFVGIKTILGYVVDEKNHDLIIIGDDDNKFPDLYLEDFVIALRNAYLKYAPLKNNVYQFSYPGCSIDPRPSVINQLDIIGQKILQSTDDQQKFIKKWKKICRQPQDVRVMGIPFNSHFANVLVQADYDMKLIVDGSEKIEYLDSLSDMNLNQVKNDIINDRPVSVSTSMNRFWFYPGENIFEEGDGIIMIEKCPVTLLTNETYVNSKNKIIDGRGPNPYAQIFVDQFSKYYDHIASQRPIFKELENMFRFIALANIIKFQNPVTNSHLDYLLEDFPIKHKTVDPTLPGRSNVKRYNHRKNLPNGYREIHFCLPSCGGVDARIDIKPEQFRRKKAKALSKIKNAVLKAKPKKAISWVAKIGHIPIISNYRDKIFLRRINNSSETASAIIVKQDRSNGNHVTYQTFDGHTEIYDGNEPIQLIDHLANYLKKNKTNKKHLISLKILLQKKLK